MLPLFAIIVIVGLEIGLTIYCFRKRSMSDIRDDLRIAKFHL